MSLLRVSSSVKGSCVMQVSSSVKPNQDTITTAEYGTLPIDTGINFIYQPNVDGVTYSQDKVSLKFELKGPGNYKWKGHASGDSSANLRTDLLSGGDLGGGALGASAAFPFVLDATGDTSGETQDVQVIGATAAAGNYNLTIKCHGAPVKLRFGFLDSAGTLTQFDFDGFSHGEAEIKLIKA